MATVMFVPLVVAILVLALSAPAVALEGASPADISATPAASSTPSAAFTPVAPFATVEFESLPLRRLLERLRDAFEATTAALAALAQPPMAEVVRSGPRSSGAVALTFDDGYNSRACARIADSLRKQDAIGTFFINGNYLKRVPETWQRILEGMPVANHTRSHRDLTRVPDRVVSKQLRENARIHERVLGRPMLKLLRPSYGAFDDRVRRIAYRLGYERLVLWNVDTHDWERDRPVRSIVRLATGARPGSIILMHCGRKATAKALPAIIRDYRERGIELAGLPEVIGP